MGRMFQNIKQSEGMGEIERAGADSEPFSSRPRRSPACGQRPLKAAPIHSDGFLVCPTQTFGVWAPMSLVCG